MKKYPELKQIRIEMILRNISTEDMAKTIGVTEQTMRDKITGRGELKRTEIKALSEKYDIPLLSFFAD